MPRESAIEFVPLGEGCEVCELSCRFALLGVLLGVLGGEYNFEKLAPVCVCNAPPVVSTLVFIHGIWVVFC
jgi:hypothetical protein